MKRVLFVAIAALAAGQAMAVNKCTIGGKVVYQEAACPGSGEPVADDIARRQAEANQRKAEAARAQEEAAKATQQREARRAQRMKVCQGKLHDEPAIGMTVETWQNCTDFWERHGSGTRVNETETAAGVRRQHVFDSYSIKYLYTTNGVITGIQR